MTRPQVVIWGSSGQARVIAEIVELEARFQIAGFLDDVHPERSGQDFSGYPILGGQEQLPVLLSQGVNFVLFGFGNNQVRLRLGLLAEQYGFELASAVHPTAVISRSADAGPGLLVQAGAIIESASQIGRLATVSTGTIISHDCRIGDGVRLSARSMIGGGSEIGTLAWIGVGATISDHISIGEGSLIGAGSVVVNDIPAGVVAYGVPARVIRTANEHDF